MNYGYRPQSRRSFLRKSTYVAIIAVVPLTTSSCAPLLASPERIAQLFVKAYLEADVDRVNRYLSDTFGTIYELGWLMDVDGLPIVIDSDDSSGFGTHVIVEAHGKASNDPVLQYFVDVVDRKVADYGPHY